MTRPAAVLLAIAALLIGLWLLAQSAPRDAVDAGPAARRTSAFEAALDLASDGAGDLPVAGTDGAATLRGREADLPDRGIVAVTLVGPTGVALEGVPLSVTRPDRIGPQRTRSIVTDASGQAVIPDAPYDGSASVRVHVVHKFGQRRLDLGFADVGEVVGPRLTARCDVGVPVQVRLVAANGGRVLEADLIAYPTFVSEHGLFELRRHLAVAAAPNQDVQFDVPSVDGYVAFDRPPYSVSVPPRTRRILVDIPARPEARLRLVFPASVSPSRQASFSPDVTVGGMEVGDVHLEFDALGRANLRGVPFIPGARVQVFGLDEGPGSGVASTVGREGSLRFSTDARDDHALELSELAEWYTAEFDEDIESEEVVVEPERVSWSGSVAVRVMDGAGHPAAGARIWGDFAGGREGVTDADGRCLIKHAKPGTQRLTVWGAGAPTHRDVVVPKDGRLEVDVRARVGGRVRLSVTDAQGRPQPFARFYVRQPSEVVWADLRPDGTLRADPFVDADGTRTLHEVEPGQVLIRAWLGDRAIEKTLDVADGRTHELVLTLP